MADEQIISKGNWFEARMMTIVQTHKIFGEKLQESPGATIDMELYYKDIGMLLNLLNKAGEELHGKRIILNG